MGSKTKPLPPKQSVEFKSLKESEIIKKFSEKCIDVSSLWLNRKISA